MTAPILPTDAGTVPVSVPRDLATALADPAVAGSLVNLLHHADLIALLIQGLDGLIARSDVIGDSLLAGIEEIRGAREAGDVLSLADLKGKAEALGKLAATAPRVAELATETVMDELALFARGLESGVRSYAAEPMAVNGVFALAKALKDPDVSRALSYILTIVRAIGREIRP